MGQLPSGEDYTWIAASDMTIQCGAIGLAINQSMAFGAATIIADERGPDSEIVEHGVTGWRYPRGDLSRLVDTVAEVLQQRSGTRTDHASGARADAHSDHDREHGRTARSLHLRRPPNRSPEEGNSMKISVFGLGYVGAVSCGCLAELGHDVVGVDVSESKVALVNEGRSPIIEPQLPEILDKARQAGKISATTDAAEAVRRSDLAFVCVGTPSLRHGRRRRSIPEASDG